VTAEGRARRVAFAPAKINLTLRVVGRRPDGYHDLESLVVFADIGDTLALDPGSELALTITGDTAAQAGASADNLVLKAASALSAQVPGLRTGHFTLTKSLPVAAGLGGGSSDAGAALRLLAQANPEQNLYDDPRLMAAAAQTGADVPVCVTAVSRIMRGIGADLSPQLYLPTLSAILVNPRVSAPTAAVFKAWRTNAPRPTETNDPAIALAERATSPAATPDPDALIAALQLSGNDLEDAAISLHPVIAEMLAALRRLAGCRLARMSGSGATCFALFDPKHVRAAAAEFKAAYPHWWVKATTLG
jgi:4-diphosphocytidyl-2-C-methyl-D-erythritol kinase